MQQSEPLAKHLEFNHCWRTGETSETAQSCQCFVDARASIPKTITTAEHFGHSEPTRFDDAQIEQAGHRSNMSITSPADKLLIRHKSAVGELLSS